MTTHIDWTDEARYSGIVRAVEDAGAKRLLARGEVNEADFLAGALAAMKALGLAPTRYPSSWTLGMMFGNASPLNDALARLNNSPAPEQPEND